MSKLSHLWHTVVLVLGLASRSVQSFAVIILVNESVTTPAKTVRSEMSLLWKCGTKRKVG